MPPQSLILASKSQSRRDMLARAGVPFTAEASQVDEDAIKNQFKRDGKSVEETALALAKAKAEKISVAHKDALVLGADQMLECDGAWLDKASDSGEAKQQLRFLSGKTHRLVTAAVLVRGGKLTWKNVSEARLTMRVLSEQFVEEYCTRLGDDVLNSVGCYALEGLGSQLFVSVEGDFFGILGLPLYPLLQELRAQGILKA